MGAGLWPNRAALGACGWLCVGLCHWRWNGLPFGGLVVVMNKDEAMKLALEALEYRAHGPVSGEKDLTDRAITTLRTAIEQAEKQEPVGEVVQIDPADDEDGPHAWVALYNDVALGTKFYTTPPAAPVQEPVAWKNAAIRLGEELSSVGPDGYYDMTAEQWLDWALDQRPRGKNTIPPAQEFVCSTGLCHYKANKENI
jgi:hypothetical protein